MRQRTSTRFARAEDPRYFGSFQRRLSFVELSTDSVAFFTSSRKRDGDTMRQTWHLDLRKQKMETKCIVGCQIVLESGGTSESVRGKESSKRKISQNFLPSRISFGQGHTAAHFCDGRIDPRPAISVFSFFAYWVQNRIHVLKFSRFLGYGCRNQVWHKSPFPVCGKKEWSDTHTKKKKKQNESVMLCQVQTDESRRRKNVKTVKRIKKV